MCANELGLRVEQAPEYAPRSGAKVSIFGVFHDGRMEEQAWLPLEPKLAATFGGKRTCEIGYGKRLRAGDDALAHQVDHMIRENGIDDGRVNPHSGAEANIVGAQALLPDVAARVGELLDQVADRLEVAAA